MTTPPKELDKQISETRVIGVLDTIASRGATNYYSYFVGITYTDGTKARSKSPKPYREAIQAAKDLAEKTGAEYTGVKR